MSSASFSDFLSLDLTLIVTQLSPSLSGSTEVIDITKPSLIS